MAKSEVLARLRKLIKNVATTEQPSLGQAALELTHF
jgi:hypothetical protein